jgi:hypothetical protein
VTTAHYCVRHLGMFFFVSFLLANSLLTPSPRSKREAEGARRSSPLVFDAATPSPETRVFSPPPLARSKHEGVLATTLVRAPPSHLPPWPLARAASPLVFDAAAPSPQMQVFSPPPTLQTQGCSPSYTRRPHACHHGPSCARHLLSSPLRHSHSTPPSHQMRDVEGVLATPSRSKRKGVRTTHSRSKHESFRATTLVHAPPRLTTLQLLDTCITCIV